MSRPSLASRLARAVARNWGAILFNLAFLLLLGVGLELGLTYALNHPALVAGSPALLNALRIIHDEERVQSIQYLPECAEYDPETTYRLKPGNCRFASTEFDTGLEVNSMGLRGDEPSLDGPEIIVLGDSFAMGWGVGQQETFARQLAELTGMKVLNAGISSFATTRELRMLARLDRSHLKALVIQYCDNDLRENAAFAEGGNDLQIMAREEYERRSADMAGRSYWFGRYANRLRKSAASILGARLRAGLGLEEQARPSTDGEEARLFVNVLRHSPVALDGVPIIVFELLPYAANDDRFAAALRAEIADPGNPAWLRGMRVLDMAPTLGPEDYYLLDDHITAKGHAKVAGALAHAVGEAVAP